MGSTDVANLAASIELLKTDLETVKADYNESLDTIWMLLAAMLVFFMHTGFAFLESGSVRVRSVQHMLAKNLIVVTVGFLCWYIFGFAVAFGVTEEPSRFGGRAHFAMAGLLESRDKFRFWWFQGAFCATGATIVSGAMAERTTLTGFGLYIVMMTSIIYPIVVYWGWSGAGMLNDANGESIVGPGLIDFAGSGLVHLVGGMGALCGAIIVGARKGRFDHALKAEFEAHNIPLCVLGTFFLWFGWYGFNCGSTGSMHDRWAAFTAGNVAVNTTLAPCVAGLLVFFLRALVVSPKMLDIGGFCNGILAGLVSITAGCSSVIHWEAIIIGFVGGLIYQGTSMLMLRLKIDDVVDAFAVHGACGLWGLVACGLFGNPETTGGNGALYGSEGGKQLGTQLFAALLIVVWTGMLSISIFFPLRILGLLRASEHFQDKGADVLEHCPPRSYSISSKVQVDATVV